MNAFDYFFENNVTDNKLFLVGKEELSFNDLYNKSVHLANEIRDAIGDNKNVMLLSPNNAFFVISYLAILKSGNVCIPLDPMLEADKFEYIKGETDAKLLFLNPQVQRRLKIQDEDCIVDISHIENSTAEFQGSTDFDDQQCAEMIFTSGSTGAPKGVMLSHKNIKANTSSIIQYLGLTREDRMLSVLPLYYCYGLSLLHTHLKVGGSLVFNNSFIFIGAVLNDLKNNKCTGFAGVPSHFQILLRKSDTFKTTEFPDLKYVTQAGGKLPSVFIDEFKEILPDTKFFVMYGQTEATARLSYLPPNEYEKHKDSIGKGIPGVTLKVIDKEGNEVTEGETGEIVAKGDNVMMGYFNDPESTKETIKDGWLSTGDLGVIDKDGFIYLTARKKEILKVGGKRISPKEIEAVILAMPNVVDCSIEGVEDELMGEALKATVNINNKEGEKLTEKDIKEHCSQHLELYKIPQLFEIKEQMNMSATGKKIKSKVDNS